MVDGVRHVPLRAAAPGRCGRHAQPPGEKPARDHFAWSEVEKVERVRVLGLPFFGEGVRITPKEVMFRGVPR